MTNGLLDRFNNTMSGLPMSANLGLLTAGASLLDGGKIGNAVQAGLGTYQSLSDMEEKKKRRLAIQGLLADGNYTDQERALISASANPAAVALQIKNSKANQANFSTLNPEELKAMGFPEGSIVQKNNLTGQIDVVNRAEVTDRKIVESADGFKYYVDTGERVFPNVEKPGEEPKTERGADDYLYYATGPNKGERVFPDIEKIETLSARTYQSKGTYKDLVSGELVGEVSLDTRTGEYFVGTPNTDSYKVIDMTKVRPVTDSYFNIGILNGKQFTDLRDNLKSDKVSLTRLKSYFENQQGSNTGLDRLTDQFLTTVKTLMTKKELTQEELKLAVAKGQVQGLLGAFRIETVGGGVMTEQDALRVLRNLGGNVDIFQNPEVVRAQLKRLFEDKLLGYDTKIEDYNAQLIARYSDLGFKKMEPLGFGTSIFDVEAPKNSDLGNNEYSKMTRDEINKLFLEADLSSLSKQQVKSLLKRWQEVK